jgi:hypothetical protein
VSAQCLLACRIHELRLIQSEQLNESAQTKSGCPQRADPCCRTITKFFDDPPLRGEIR